MKQIMRVGLLVVLPLIAFTAGAGETSVYMWKDKHGVTHFGDKPQGDAEEMVVRTSEPSAPAAQQQSEEQAGPSKGDSEECKTARKQLADYERAPFLYETDAQGKRHILPEDERQELLEGVRKQMEAACGQ